MELRGLLTRADGRDLPLGEIVESIPHRGHVLMIVLFSFPMSLPISPPFLGGVFGMVLTFLSFYLVMGQKPWMPHYLHQKPVSYRVLETNITRLSRVMRYLEFVLKPRMLFLTKDERLWRIHGSFLLFMSVVLALPIPMPAPFTNSVAALPIFLTSLGMLERDGRMIVVGYFSTLLCVTYYLALILMGKEAFEYVWRFFGW